MKVSSRMMQQQRPRPHVFALDGGLDLVTMHQGKKPGSILAGANIEMVAGRQGYGRIGGYERCCDDFVPSNVAVKFFRITNPIGGAIAIGDAFTTTGTGGGDDGVITSGFKIFGNPVYSLENIDTPVIGQIIVVATHGNSFIPGFIYTGTTSGFTLLELVADTSAYTNSQLQAYLRSAFELVRGLVPRVPGTGEVNGGFRLSGLNYAIRRQKLYKADAGAWSEVSLPRVMYFNNGLSAFKAGDQITDGTATGTIASLTLQSGAWNFALAGVDQAAGYLTLTGVTGGPFTLSAELKVVGDAVPAVVNGAFATDTIWTKGTGWTIAAGKATRAAEPAQSDLTEPFVLATGRSVAVTFTVSDYTAGTLYPIVGSVVGSPVTANGTYTQRFTTPIGVTTAGFRGDAGFIGSVDDVSFATARRALVSKVDAAYSLPAGGVYKTVTYNFTNVANNESVYGVNGVSEAFEFDGTNFIPIFYPGLSSVFPFDIYIHQERLMLAFPGGQVAYSVAGQPRVDNPLLGSGTWSTGSEVTGFKKIHGNCLAIFSQKSIYLLLGTGIYNATTATRDWNFVQHDSSIGAVLGSVALGGAPIFASGQDFRIIQATQTSAGYESTPLFRLSQPYLQDNLDKVVCAVWCRTKAQHRIFFNNGQAVYATFDAGKAKGATPVHLPLIVRSAWTEFENGIEKMWFTSDSGYLYRMDSGNTFDDQPITGSFRVPFYSYGSNVTEKHFPELILELSAPVLLTNDTTITYAVNHAYGSVGWPRPVVETINELENYGGLYGNNPGFGKFAWGGAIVSQLLAYLDGWGPNMSFFISFSSQYDNAFSFMTATVMYIPLGPVGREI